MNALKKILQFVSETGKTVIVSLVAVFLIRSFIVQPFYVKGASMEPNFDDGEYLIVNEIGYSCVPGTKHCFGRPERGDVVVFRYPLDPSEYFIKRIVGLPGDGIAIDEGRVLVNGVELGEPYIPKSMFTHGKTSISLGEGEYYVLGDNRSASSDSRRWGVLPEKNIVGRAWFRGWPLKKAGVVPRPSYAP
ncbi:MAG: signal peptidase I [bacterium]|nr:signal peptidase I [bacterium]